MQIKIMRCHHTPIRMATVKTTCISKDVKKLEPMYTVGLLDGVTTMKISMESPLKITELLHDPEIPLLCKYPEELRVGLKEIFAHSCS